MIDPGMLAALALIGVFGAMVFVNSLRTSARLDKLRADRRAAEKKAAESQANEFGSSGDWLARQVPGLAAATIAAAAEPVWHPHLGLRDDLKFGGGMKQFIIPGTPYKFFVARGARQSVRGGLKVPPIKR